MRNIKEVYESQWEHYFQQLASFHNDQGHCSVPGKHEKLVSWIERQRLAKKDNALPADREKRLDAIGFSWSCEGIKKRLWDERYAQLRAYHRQHGHSFVPVNFRENKSLGTWVATQRGLEAQGRLGPVKKKMLDTVGFVWSRDTQRQVKSAYDTQWEFSFQKLQLYKQVHGSCQVSLKIDPALQRWTCWQRRLFCQGRLPPERIDRLNEIRFPWSVQEGYWMRMYDALVDFNRQFGHTRVPSQWKPDPRLAAWVYRVRLNQPELTQQKIELLNSIGFDWTLSQRNVVPWGEMYNRLVAFKQQRGHAHVPVRFQEDPKLGKWASKMRHERGKLAPERVSLLDAVGFSWGSKPAMVYGACPPCKIIERYPPENIRHRL